MQDLHTLPEHRVFLVGFETFFIFVDGEHHMFKWEQLEDTKGVIRSRKSKKDIQHTGQAKNHERKNNNP
jgi:hypothetical protein